MHESSTTLEVQVVLYRDDLTTRSATTMEQRHASIATDVDYRQFPFYYRKTIYVLGGTADNGMTIHYGGQETKLSRVPHR